MSIKLTNIFNIRVFLISFFIGLFFVYVIGSDLKSVYVYPSPETYKDMVVKDAAGNCFKYKQTSASCDASSSEINTIPVQHIVEDDVDNSLWSIFTP